MSVPPFRIRWFGKIVVLGIGPHAAGETVPPGASLNDVCSGNRGMIVDLTGYELVSSEALGQLIHANRVATESGSRLRICCPEEAVRQVMTLTNLNNMVPVFATLAEALADFGPLAE